MQALILSGGQGTRLRPLTFSCPKPLIPFCNAPILEWQISALVNAGVKKIILAVSSSNHEFDKIIHDFVRSCSERNNVEIILSVEKTPLGTGGPIALAGNHLTSENFFVLNGDVICDYPFKKLLEFHLKSKAEGSILVAEVEDPSKFGVVISDENNKIIKFIEKPKKFVGNCINGGVYCFNKNVLKRIPNETVSIEKTIFPQMAMEGSLFCFKHLLRTNDNFWMDVGQPKDFIRATKTFIKANSFKNTDIIDPSAKIAKSAKVGHSVVIGKNCIVKDNAILENCVLFEGSEVGEDSIVKDSIIGWKGVVGKNCTLKNTTVIGKGVRVKNGATLDGDLVPSKTDYKN